MHNDIKFVILFPAERFGKRAVPTAIGRTLTENVGRNYFTEKLGRISQCPALRCVLYELYERA